MAVTMCDTKGVCDIILDYWRQGIPNVITDLERYRDTKCFFSCKSGPKGCKDLGNDNDLQNNKKKSKDN